MFEHFAKISSGAQKYLSYYNIGQKQPIYEYDYFSEKLRLPKTVDPFSVVCYTLTTSTISWGFSI